jgi:16S rRNA (adenine1518-N6/adenine1519-N6)-dimethyltransferase
MDKAHPGAQLLGPAEIREIADRLGIRPAKRLGQNFVIDPGTIRRIVGQARLRQQDVVVEVGPGLGSLTLGLLEAAERVVAVEVDPVLAGELPRTIAARAAGLAGRLEVVTADALTVQVLPDPPATALVGNLPYNVAVPVVLHLLEVMPSIEHALVMVQAEVADRICAQPGGRIYGVPSVKLAWYATARRAGTVSRSVFWPVPNVDSALVALTRWPDGGAPADKLAGQPGAGQPGAGRRAADQRSPSRTAVFAVIDAAFAQRRKTLRSALASWAGSAQAAERVLRDAGVDPALRGEAIGIDQYIRIALAASQARTIIES